jgi:hypothetical protein
MNDVVSRRDIVRLRKYNNEMSYKQTERREPSSARKKAIHTQYVVVGMPRQTRSIQINETKTRPGFHAQYVSFGSDPSKCAKQKRILFFCASKIPNPEMMPKVRVPRLLG